MFLWTCLVSTNIYIFISITASVSESLYSDNNFHTWRGRSMVHCKCFFRGGQSINTRWQKCLRWWWYLYYDEVKWWRWWSNVQMCHSGWLSPWIPEYHSPSPSLATAMTNTKYRYKKNLINNINASQQWWKLTNTNVSMGFWAKTRVEWSGYPFDCYDDCGSKTPFFNSTKANSKAIWAMPIWKQHIWRRGFPEYKSNCGANKFDKYKDKYIQDIKHKQEGQPCI